MPTSSPAPNSPVHSTSPTHSRALLLLAAALVCGALFLCAPVRSASRDRSAQLTYRLIETLPRSLRPTGVQRGYWHTVGNRIVDTRGRTVRIAGLNWSGFETPSAVPGGLEQQDYRAILRTVRANGYNTVRIPFSNQMVEAPDVPSHIAFTSVSGPINSDLNGLDSLEILDHIIAAAGEQGLRVILDNHRSEAGSSAQESGLWYTDRYPESAWIADWVTLAKRYSANATVIGVDLRNEPHNAATGGACWSCGGPNDWHLAAARAGNAILRVNPRLLILVEGTDAVDGSTTWWGGNLAGVRHAPVRLDVPGRLVYSPHVYGPAEYAQPWFNAETTPATLATLWRHDWAYISESGMAPVALGEFGTPNSDEDIRSSAPGSEGQWFSSLVSFLQAHPAIGWNFWSLNGEDRYGLLDAAYTTTSSSSAKAQALASISGTPAAGVVPSAPLRTETAMLSRSQGNSAAITVVPVGTSASEFPFAGNAPAPAAEAQTPRSDVARAWRSAPPAAPSISVAQPALPADASPRGIRDAMAEGVRHASHEALDQRGGADR